MNEHHAHGHYALLLAQWGDADEAQVAAALAAHLSECAECRQAELAVEALLTRFRTLAAPPLSSDLEERLLNVCGGWTERVGTSSGREPA